ncbi:MAG: hypothetical protein HON76_18020 [Candidatus Scalindua sp.]|jgi:hypothetical protein|nr:hypothetical protein [Candidatus Scalindua sp.]MBT5306376.1 hypothetical protein [Candidatus Scalindua sp.]MBT6225233.1 hypothetical protein [Candidatus Scalindua sp.]MBT6564418.1 hypothetical protein [Candidatus Scalindua sp.]MBT7210028.1 hypothetical protein [Candidatus Scalindua sp.]
MTLILTITMIAILHFLLHYVTYRINLIACTKVLQEPIERVMLHLPISEGGRILFYLLQVANSLIWGIAISFILTLIR